MMYAIYKGDDIPATFSINKHKQHLAECKRVAQFIFINNTGTGGRLAIDCRTGEGKTLFS